MTITVTVRINVKVENGEGKNLAFFLENDK